MKETQYQCRICGNPLYRLDSKQGYACPNCDLVVEDIDEA